MTLKIKMVIFFSIIYFSLSFWADAIKVVAFRHQLSLQQNYDNRNNVEYDKVSVNTAELAESLSNEW